MILLKIIIGLGNPGNKYFGTRHNIGFHAIDYIAEKNGIKVNKLKHKALIGEGNISGEKVVLVKPQTFMNSSGESVRPIIDWYKAKLSDIIVIYDDVSLDVGKIRIREKGSAGGHNGIKSIILHLSSDEFLRIKIGVSMPNNANYELADYVLSEFSKDEQKEMFEVLGIVENATSDIIASSVYFAMNKYNGQSINSDLKDN